MMFTLMKQSAVTLGLIAWVLPLAGCAEGIPRCHVTKATEAEEVTREYVLVEYRVGEISGMIPQAEITRTRTYEATRTTLKSVALRLPDNCFRRGVVSEGTNTSTGNLESVCGVPLQVLEKTLSNANFRVLSWSTLMGIERDQHVPVHIAAQQLGADLVILVNEMYIGNGDTGGEAKANYKYFTSDERGARKQPKELFQGDRDWFKSFIRERLGDDPKAQGKTTLQARLNATVVLAKGVDMKPGETARPDQPRSGESIWFYNWRLGREQGSSGGMKFLFAGESGGRDEHRWWPVIPKGIAPTRSGSRDQATSEENFSSRTEVNMGEAEKLYREVAEDFIKRFQGG